MILFVAARWFKANRRVDSELRPHHRMKCGGPTERGSIRNQNSLALE